MHHFMLPNLVSISACLAATILSVAGCGTTRSSDTARTATEQLLISDAVDRAIQSVNFGPLAGQTIYLDDSKLSDAVDKNYIVSTLRQHMLASGCILRDSRSDAEFIVEARAGAVGTDRNDLLFGIPATNVPQILPLQGVPAAIPEVPLAKRRDQRGVAKISMFAYQRQTGLPVWQSGLAIQESSSNDVWLFGAGPFQHGTIYQDAKVANASQGKTGTADASPSPRRTPVSLSEEATFASPERLAKQVHRLPAAGADAVAASTPGSQPTPSTATSSASGLGTPANPPGNSAAAKVAAASPAAPASATGASDGANAADAGIPNVMVQTKKTDPPKPINRPPDTQSVRSAPTKSGDSALPQPRFDSL
jgi:hypothetical protein